MNRIHHCLYAVAAAAMFAAGCASINSSSSADRLRVVAGIEDQDELFNAIGKTKYDDVKNAAARRITREDLCLRLLTEKDITQTVRIGLVSHIDSPAELKRIALDSKLDREMRLAAVTRIHDEAILADIVLDATDTTIKAKAMNDVIDEAQCRRILVKGPHAVPEDIRGRALSHVSDEDYLVGFVKERGNEDSLRHDALERIKSEAALLDLLAVRPRLEDWVSEIAIPRVDDQPTLVDIFQDRGSSTAIRELALVRIEDVAALVPVVTDSFDDEGLRRKALPIITDESLCLQLLKAQPQPESWILSHAVSHVSDEGELSAILLSELYPQDIRRMAGENIRDKSRFERIFLDATDRFAESFAMERTDAAFLASPDAQKKLLNAFRSAHSDEVRVEFMQRLSPEADLVRSSDQRLIASALLAKDNDETRKFARQTLFDETAILDVALRGNESLGAWVLDLNPKPQTALAIALGAKSVSVQCRALLALDAEDQYARVAEKGASRAVRIAAINNLSNKSATLLQCLAEDNDVGVAEAAIRQLRETGGKRVVAALEEKAEERRKAEAERAAAAKAKQEAENRAADEKLQSDILAATATLQVHSFRYYLDKLADHPKIGPKNFRFSGRVTRNRFGTMALEVSVDGEIFTVTAKLAEKPSEKIETVDIVTIGGVYKEGSRQSVTLNDATLVCRGVP